MRVDHTWVGLHSSTNDIQLGNIRGMVTGLGETEHRALRTSQIHFIMLARMAGIVIDKNGQVVNHIAPVSEWPDPNAS